VSDDAGAISSTRVRVAVAQGDVREAERLLGRRHSIAGTVVHGDARGRTIGFPTANLGDVREMVPKPGVYAVVVDRVDGGARALARGVANVGMRPTVSAEALELRIEAHLFDFAEDLYDARIRVALVERLRDEKKFAGLSELRSQIEDDAARARAITAAVSPEGGRFT
jgi:riboflavin kinase/FMN adenylyltransferase